MSYYFNLYENYWLTSNQCFLLLLNKALLLGRADPLKTARFTKESDSIASPFLLSSRSTGSSGGPGVAAIGLWWQSR